MTETKRQNVKICFLATAAFSLVANAFAYFNLTPHHDSINHIFHFAGKWEISLGRFLQPAWETLINSVTVPWFTGLLSIFFLSLTVWFCTEILNIRSKAGIILTSGFLSVNLGHPVNMRRNKSIIILYENKPEVKEMPCYPAAGYCRMVDGRMVIKLSEEKTE